MEELRRSDSAEKHSLLLESIQTSRFLCEPKRVLSSLKGAPPSQLHSELLSNPRDLNLALQFPVRTR